MKTRKMLVLVILCALFGATMALRHELTDKGLRVASAGVAGALMGVILIKARSPDPM